MPSEGMKYWEKCTQTCNTEPDGRPDTGSVTASTEMSLDRSKPLRLIGTLACKWKHRGLQYIWFLTFFPRRNTVLLSFFQGSGGELKKHVTSPFVVCTWEWPCRPTIRLEPMFYGINPSHTICLPLSNYYYIARPFNKVLVLCYCYYNYDVIMCYYVAACGSGGRVRWLVTTRMLVWSPTSVSESMCPWARHLTAPDEPADTLHGWNCRRCVTVCVNGCMNGWMWGNIAKRVGGPLVGKGH